MSIKSEQQHIKDIFKVFCMIFGLVMCFYGEINCISIYLYISQLLFRFFTTCHVIKYFVEFEHVVITQAVG